MPLRWLLPLVAVLALLGQTVTAYAAAGLVGDAQCCCPDQSKCKCHDHDGKPAKAPVMKRCNGVAKLVAPAVQLAIVAPVTLVVEARRVDVVEHHVISLPEERSVEIETPPF